MAAKGSKAKGSVADAGTADTLTEAGVLSSTGIERMTALEDHRWPGMFLRIIVASESDTSYRYWGRRPVRLSSLVWYSTMLMTV